jgi:hypothetical protein
MKNIEQLKLYSISRNREYIFLEILNELKSRIKESKNEAYNLVRIGAILRLLFVDGSKYYNVINSRYKLKLGAKLLCSVNDVSGLSTLYDKNDHTQFLIFGVKKDGDYYNISNFLKLKVVYLNIPTLLDEKKSSHIKMEYNVNELIKLFANAHGGVHLENWKDDIHNFLSSHPLSPYNINENSDFYLIIKNISLVLLKMVESLEKEVKRNLQETLPIAYQKTDQNNIVSIIGRKSKT